MWDVQAQADANPRRGALRGYDEMDTERGRWYAAILQQDMLEERETDKYEFMVCEVLKRDEKNTDYVLIMFAPNPHMFNDKRLKWQHESLLVKACGESQEQDVEQLAALSDPMGWPKSPVPRFLFTEARQERLYPLIRAFLVDDVLREGVLTRPGKTANSLDVYTSVSGLESFAVPKSAHVGVALDAYERRAPFLPVETPEGGFRPDSGMYMATHLFTWQEIEVQLMKQDGVWHNALSGKPTHPSVNLNAADNEGVMDTDRQAPRFYWQGPDPRCTVKKAPSITSFGTSYVERFPDEVTGVVTDEQRSVLEGRTTEDEVAWLQRQPSLRVAKSGWVSWLETKPSVRPVARKCSGVKAESAFVVSVDASHPRFASGGNLHKVTQASPGRTFRPSPALFRSPFSAEPIEQGAVHEARRLHRQGKRVARRPTTRSRHALRWRRSLRRKCRRVTIPTQILCGMTTVGT